MITIDSQRISDKRVVETPGLGRGTAPLQKFFLIFFCVEIMHFGALLTWKRAMSDVMTSEITSTRCLPTTSMYSCSCRWQWSLDSGVLCWGDGTRRGAVSEALVWSTALGLRVAHSCQLSTRSRKPYIDSTPFRRQCIVRWVRRGAYCVVAGSHCVVVWNDE